MQPSEELRSNRKLEPVEPVLSKSRDVDVELESSQKLGKHHPRLVSNL